MYVSILSELISVPQNPWRALQNSLLSWSTWRDRGIEAVNDLMNGNKFISWNDVQNKFGLSKEEFFRYMQLRSEIQTFDWTSEKFRGNYI